MAVIIMDQARRMGRVRQYMVASGCVQEVMT